MIGRLADQIEIRAIVLFGKDRGYPRGNPIADRPDVSESEKISEDFNRIENCATPVIAAIAKAMGVETATAPSVKEALADAADRPAGRVLVCGSLYLAGEVLAANER